MSPPPPTWTLAQHLVPDGALPGDDQRVVEGMNERGAALPPQRVAFLPGLRVTVPVQQHVGPEQPHRVDLDFGRRLRHHDEGADTEPLGRKRDALRVVARAGRDHAAGALRVGQVGNAVVRAAQLEAEDRLQVLALEKDGPSQASRESWRHIQRRLAADVVHAAREDQPQHLFDGGRGETGRIGDGHVVAGAEHRFGPARMQQITKFPPRSRWRAN